MFLYVSVSECLCVSVTLSLSLSLYLSLCIFLCMSLYRSYFYCRLPGQYRPKDGGESTELGMLWLRPYGVIPRL